MLALQHLRWNVAEDVFAHEIAPYMFEVLAYASQHGFSGGESAMRHYPCDICLVPIQRLHVQFINYDEGLRWCYECMEHEYLRNGLVVQQLSGGVFKSVLERPEGLDRFEDKGGPC